MKSREFPSAALERVVAGAPQVHLVVQAGSLMEAEDQRGLAHFCEHLAFSATERFSNYEIVQFLERIGARFGPCQNASARTHTSPSVLLLVSGLGLGFV